jgi:Zn-dependent peptidase ImmA (M78 family)/transcriptional regulator with XRE-family HTH domain
MNDLRLVLGSRIRSARERLKLSQKELAEAIGVESHQIVSQMEKGERDVKAWELAKLADILKVEISSLLESKEPLKEHIVLWRDKPEKEKEIKEAHFLKKCREYHNLELAVSDSPRSLLPNVKIDPKTADFQTIKQLAEEISKQLNLGQKPAAAIEKVLEEQYGVKVWYLDLGEDGSAASTVGPFGPAIMMNSSEPPWRRNYNFAHELFHLLTWESLPPEFLVEDTARFDRFEKYANAFASALLLPADPIMNEFDARVKDNSISYSNLVDIARIFDVSTEALLYRLLNLKRISKKAVENTLKDGNLREIDRASMRGYWRDPSPMPERYVRLAFLAYQKGKVTRARLAEYLETSLFDLGDILKEYGFSENDNYEAQLCTV